MALSVFIDRFGVDWPLGFVAVASNGTPVSLMSRVDANNNDNPSTPARFGGNTGEYSPTCHKIFLMGYKPGNNNNGMIPNSGYVYVLRAVGPAPGNNNSGGPGNRSDSGAMVGIIPPGGQFTLPADEIDNATISPYRYTLDADTDGDGALVTLIGCVRG